jgi:anti-sigma-K factor RskA
LRPAVTAVGYSAQSAVGAGPSPLLKARLMKQIRSATPARRPVVSWAAYVAAACFAIAVGTALFNSSLRDRLVRDDSRIAQQSAMIADIAATDAKRYRFGHGTVVVHGPRLYIAMQALAQPPRGKVYQAWTLPKGSKRMAPSITFKPAATAETVIQLPQSAENVAAVAVSVEPAGGSKQPTSKPIAVVAL